MNRGAHSIFRVAPHGGDVNHHRITSDVDGLISNEFVPLHLVIGRFERRLADPLLQIRVVDAHRREGDHFLLREVLADE
jgi:hypothetical protein